MSVPTTAVKEKFGLKRLAQILFVLGIFIIIIFPIYYIVSTTVRTSQELGGKYWNIIPQTFTLDNFEEMTTRQYVMGFRNSIITSLANTALCLVLALPVAYIFTRASFRFDNHLFFFVIMQRMSPPGAFIVPVFMIYISLNIYDTLIATVIAHSIFNLPLAVWILSGFMKDIPTTIDEQAFIDGYSMWGFWRKIYIPLLLPAIGVTGFFVWMFSWTEVVLASAVTRNSAFPLTVQLLLTTGSIYGGAQYGAVCTAGVISMIPGLIILYFVRNQIARGFMLGGKVGA